MEIESNEILPFPIEQKESIKLSKNAKGDYQWEIKLLEINIIRLEELNKQMVERFELKK